jgi:hypothetical protein
MGKDFIATITNEERAADIEAIFGSRDMFLKSFIPDGVLWNGETKLAYQIDLEMYGDEIIDKLTEFLATKFSIPIEDVKRDLPAIGCPLLADDCIIEVKNPMRWID